MYARATCISIAVLLAACGKDDGAATTPTTSDGGASSSSSSSSSSGSVASCTEADLGKCDYPERKLKFTEQGGLNIPETHTARTIPILARIPEGAGPFPVVIWSHGGGFDPQGHLQSKEWGAAFAEQGYVALNVGHPPLTKEALDYICSEAKIPAAECSSAGVVDEDNALVAMMKQVDLLAVVDKLKTMSDESVVRGGPTLDLTKVVAAGWSAGSRSALLMFGTKLKTTPSAPLFAKPDSRVMAVIALSPGGPGFGGYYDDGAETSWSKLRGPVFMATGQNDFKDDKPGLTGPVRRFAFSAQPADGTRRLLYSNLPAGVGRHGTYNLGDVSSSDERLARLSRSLRSSVLAFLDANVKSDATAKDWLGTSNAKVLAGDADWESR